MDQAAPELHLVASATANTSHTRVDHVQLPAVSTFILVGLFSCAPVCRYRCYRWWPVKAVALLVALTCLALMVAHIVYLFVGA